MINFLSNNSTNECVYADNKFWTYDEYVKKYTTGGSNKHILLTRKNNLFQRQTTFEPKLLADEEALKFCQNNKTNVCIYLNGSYILYKDYKHDSSDFPFVYECYSNRSHCSYSDADRVKRWTYNAFQIERIKKSYKKVLNEEESEEEDNDVINDIILCDAIKRDGFKCTAPARKRFDGRCYCLRHYKIIAGIRPPKKGKKRKVNQETPNSKRSKNDSSDKVWEHCYDYIFSNGKVLNHLCSYLQSINAEEQEAVMNRLIDYLNDSEI